MKINSRVVESVCKGDSQGDFFPDVPVPARGQWACRYVVGGDGVDGYSAGKLRRDDAGMRAISVV